MLNEQTMDKLHAMKLNGMADAFKEQLEQPNIDQLTFEERFGLLVDRHWIWKEDRRMKRLIRAAKLRINACIEDINYRKPRGIDRSVVLRLASCQWITNTQNILITGPTGAGKTYLSCAFGNKACREGFATLYRRAPKLFQEVAIARADGSYAKLMNKYAKAKLLIVDDFGLAPLSDPERRDLLEVIEDRQGLSSTIVVSQVPIENWHENIGDPTIADAILDRLIHNAHKFELEGDSMRKAIMASGK